MKAVTESKSAEPQIVTPGDWVVKPLDDFRVAVIARQTPQSEPVVAICGGAERHTNARRMSAVNDLYEGAHQLICGVCDTRVGWKGKYDAEQRRLGRQDWRKCPGCRALRLALAKADGIEPGVSGGER